VATATQQRTFLADVLDDARHASATTGLPVAVVLAQWAVETGFGTSPAWRRGHNYAGVSPGGRVAYYPDRAAGLAAYEHTMGLHYYDPVRAAGRTGNIGATIDALAASPWASGQYVDRAGTPGGSLRGALPAVFTFDPAAAASGAVGGNASVVPVIGPPTLQVPGIPFPIPNPTEIPGLRDLPGKAAGAITNPIADAIEKAVGSFTRPLARIAFGGLFLAAGLGLVVMGAWRTLPDSTRQRATQTAAMGAAL
jgi:hypothetical protein